MYVHGKPQGSEKHRVLTRVPYSYDDSMSILGSVLDNSIAQSGYIKPAGRPAKRLRKRLPSQWGDINFKFDFSKGKWIERRGYAIDSKGEVNELNAFRMWRELPEIKQQNINFDSPNVNIDMYGFDKMNRKFQRMFRRLKIG